jgi:hypothetical protein
MSNLVPLVISVPHSSWKLDTTPRGRTVAVFPFKLSQSRATVTFTSVAATSTGASKYVLVGVGACEAFDTLLVDVDVAETGEAAEFAESLALLQY